MGREDFISMNGEKSDKVQKKGCSGERDSLLLATWVGKELLS